VIEMMIDVSFQLYIMDDWFKGFFSSNGQNMIAISRMSVDERSDAMIEIFPRVNKIMTSSHRFYEIFILLRNYVLNYLFHVKIVTKVLFFQVINCSTKSLSISGDPQNAICLLTQNLLYEKIAIFIWYW